MQLSSHTDAARFQARVWPLLMEREAENNLMIGIIGCLSRGDRPESVGGTGQPMFWTVEGGSVIAAALVTPPHRLVVTRMPLEVVKFLARELRQRNVAMPGVVGPRETAEQFAELWRRQTGHTAKPSHALRIYQLDHVSPVASVPGRMETAHLDDLDLVQRWNEAFRIEAGIAIPARTDQIQHRIEAGEFVLWRDGEVASMAVAVGPTPHGIRIGAVYTPPEHRRHGYATALVAALSQRLLDSGRRFCFLFADSANPTSNSIYAKIGYRPVCDFVEYDFVVKRGTPQRLTQDDF